LANQHEISLPWRKIYLAVIFFSLAGPVDFAAKIDLSQVSENDLLNIHGMAGPTAFTGRIS
jgi:hypothetical protein